MQKIVQHNFLGGQLDFEMMGRQDVEKYKSGASSVTNLIFHKRGGIFKRPGTDLVKVLLQTSTEILYRFIPFTYRQDEGWCLFFSASSSDAQASINAYNNSGGSVAISIPAGIDFYNGHALAEFDYCQCGDVMYLAHRDFQPLKISHSVLGQGANASHSFSLSKAIGNYGSGSPAISSATVTKQGVTINSATVTETYKVSAVFDGVETFPSSEFSGATANDSDASNYAAWEAKFNKKVCADYNPILKVYSGTSYHLPWTQSQKISLNISPQKRSGSDPEQIKIFRKNGSIFGLVGVISTGANSSSIADDDSDALQPHTGASSNYPDLVDSTKYISYGDDAAAPGAAGIDVLLSDMTAEQRDYCGFGRTGIVLNATDLASWNDDNGTGTWESGKPSTKSKYTRLEIDASARYKLLQIDILLGSVQITSDTAETGSPPVEVTTMTFAYHPFAQFLNGGGGTSFKLSVKAGTSTTTYNIASSSPASPYTRSWTTTQFEQATIAKEHEDESQWTSNQWPADDESFEHWAKRMAKLWLDSFGHTKKLTLTSTSSTATSFTIWANNNKKTGTFTLPFVISGIRVKLKSQQDTDDEQQGPTPQGDGSYSWDDRNWTPDASQTPIRPVALMNKQGDYPGCVCVSQQRLIWASTANSPARIMMSRIGDFRMFSPHEVMVPDDPIDFEVSATRFPAINHLVEMRKLLLFNGDAEWVVDSASSNSGITFETIQARQHSAIGAAANLKPIVCNNSLIFAERTGQAVRRYGYSLEDDGFGGEDISIFASSIFAEKKIVSWAYQQHPHSMLWCVLSDGSLASLTFNREQNTVAWATHNITGTRILAIAATSALLGNNPDRPDTSQILLLAQRDIGNYKYYYILQMRPESNRDSDSFSNALCLDFVHTLNSGQAIPAGFVAFYPSTGEQTTSNSGQRICGIPMSSRFTSAFPVTGDDIGTGMTGIKAPQHAHLRLVHSTGGKIGAFGSPSELMQNLPVSHSASSGNVTFSQTDADIPLAASNNPDGRITILHESHLPFGLVRLETDIATEDD